MDLLRTEQSSVTHLLVNSSRIVIGHRYRITGRDGKIRRIFFYVIFEALKVFLVIQLMFYLIALGLRILEWGETSL